MGSPGTCSTSLQYISGPAKPQVAFDFISAMEARFSTAGNSPGKQRLPFRSEQNHLRMSDLLVNMLFILTKHTQKQPRHLAVM